MASSVATPSSTVCYTVTVDFDRTIEEMVSAGKYDLSNPHINSKNFHAIASGTHTMDIQLVHFDRKMKSSEILAELDRLDLRPATLPVLLGFIAAFSDLGHFPIAALGSWCYSRRSSYIGDVGKVVVLFSYDSVRELDLYPSWPGRTWFGTVRFAAVRK